MKKQLREKAIYLRTQKRMSYGQIKDRLNISKSTLSYWLREYPLSEEEISKLRSKNWSKGEASRERYRKTMRLKKDSLNRQVYEEQKKKFKNLKNKDYYLAGLMLYLGEGAKKKESALVLANSDPKIIKFFIWWLKVFLGVSKKDVRIQLHLYENMDLEKEKKYWKGYLGVSDRQIYKLSVRKITKNSFTYRSSNMRGTCSLYVFGVDRVRNVMMAIQALLDSYQ